MLRPTSGRILLNGEDVTGLPSNRISQKGIARSYQITNILPNATVLENVRIAAQSRRHAWSMLTHHNAYRDLIEKAEAALDAVGLRSKEDETRRQPLAWRAAQPSRSASRWRPSRSLLCLDEPTAGMSAAETHETMQLVKTHRQGPHDPDRRARHAGRDGALPQDHGAALRPDSRRGTPEESSRIPGCRRSISRHDRARDHDRLCAARPGRRPARLLWQEPHPARYLADGGARRGRGACSAATASAKARHSRPSWALVNRARAASPSRAAPSPTRRRTSSRASASPMCLRIAASSACLP